MNLQDRFAELLLAAFDRLMDWVTRGTWSRWQGSHKVNLKVKE